MRQISCLLLLLQLVTATSNARAQSSLDGLIDRELPSLLTVYRGLHAAPELSRKEEKTSTVVAQKLRTLGFEVTERVGHYLEPGETSYGVVGVLRNGKGPTVLVRTDMDALPVTEEVDIPFASKARSTSALSDGSWIKICGCTLPSPPWSR